MVAERDQGWTYVVPMHALETVLVQVQATARHVLQERLRVEIHADVTRRIFQGQGPGTVPVGLLSDDITSYALPQGVFLSGNLSVDAIEKRGPAASLHRRPRAMTMEVSDASGPEWVYPGDAAGGIFRDAVTMVLLHGDRLAQEILSQ